MLKVKVISLQYIFQVLYVLCFTGPRYQVSVYRTIGPLVYNTNVDLVNDNVYTKFGLNRSIRFQDIEQKLNSDVNQRP